MSLLLLAARARMNHLTPTGARRWWRLLILDNNGHTMNIGLGEITMFADLSMTTNLALLQPSFATTSDSRYPSSKAFDGSPDSSSPGGTSMWASASGNVANQAIGVQLASPAVINVVQIWMRGGNATNATQAPKDFIVQASADSTTGLDGTWTNEWTVSNSTGWAMLERRTFARP